MESGLPPAPVAEFILWIMKFEDIYSKIERSGLVIFTSFVKGCFTKDEIDEALTTEVEYRGNRHFVRDGSVAVRLMFDNIVNSHNKLFGRVRTHRISAGFISGIDMVSVDDRKEVFSNQITVVDLRNYTSMSLRQMAYIIETSISLHSVFNSDPEHELIFLVSGAKYITDGDKVVDFNPEILGYKVTDKVKKAKAVNANNPF